MIFKLSVGFSCADWWVCPLSFCPFSVLFSNKSTLWTSVLKLTLILKGYVIHVSSLLKSLKWSNFSSKYFLNLLILHLIFFWETKYLKAQSIEEVFAKLCSLQIAVLFTVFKRSVSDGKVECLAGMRQSLGFDPQHHITLTGYGSASCMHPSTQRWRQKSLKSVSSTSIQRVQPFQDRRACLQQQKSIRLWRDSSYKVEQLIKM